MGDDAFGWCSVFFPGSCSLAGEVQLSHTSWRRVPSWPLRISSSLHLGSLWIAILLLLEWSCLYFTDTYVEIEGETFCSWPVSSVG